LLASCQNEVIHPWSQDKVVDEQFPAEGPVYQEAPKGFVGLAGESRSGDANGQWFRVLAAGGTNLVTLRPGVFATTTNEILGANPPKPQGRPPLNAAAPCEVQQTPDLRSQPGKPPQQQQVDITSELFKDRFKLAQAAAVKWLTGKLEDEGLGGQLEVGPEDATQELIDKIPKVPGP